MEGREHSGTSPSTRNGHTCHRVSSFHHSFMSLESHFLQNVLQEVPGNADWWPEMTGKVFCADGAAPLAIIGSQVSHRPSLRNTA